MIFRINICILVIFFSASIMSCKSVTHNNEKNDFVLQSSGSTNAVDDRAIKPFIWSVLHKDSKEISYLMGTMHLGIKLDSLPRKIKEIISKSKQLYVENSNVSKPIGQIRVVLALAKELRFKKKYVLEETDKQKLADILGSFADVAEYFPPYFICAALITKGLEGEEGQLDTEIVTYAKSHKISVKSLEGVGTQIKVLQNICDVNGLVHRIRMYDSTTSKEFLSLVKSGNIEEVLSYLEESYRKDQYSEAVKNIMLYDRNLEWSKKLEKPLLKKSTFVAVGLAHLVGDSSLIDFLREEGFVINRLNL